MRLLRRRNLDGRSVCDLRYLESGEFCGFQSLIRSRLALRSNGRERKNGPSVVPNKPASCASSTLQMLRQSSQCCSSSCMNVSASTVALVGSRVRSKKTRWFGRSMMRRSEDIQPAGLVVGCSTMHQYPCDFGSGGRTSSSSLRRRSSCSNVLDAHNSRAFSASASFRKTSRLCFESAYACQRVPSRGTRRTSSERPARFRRQARSSTPSGVV